MGAGRARAQSQGGLGAIAKVLSSEGTRLRLAVESFLATLRAA
jgi:hypothetical protein